jgi:hypothetical protein
MKGLQNSTIFEGHNSGLASPPNPVINISIFCTNGVTYETTATQTRGLLSRSTAASWTQSTDGFQIVQGFTSERRGLGLQSI